MEITAGKGSIAALLVAALSSGGTVATTRMETSSVDRCVEISAAQRTADLAEHASQRAVDLESYRAQMAASIEESDIRVDAITAICVQSMETLQGLCN